MSVTFLKGRLGESDCAVLVDPEDGSAVGPIVYGEDATDKLLAFIGWAGLTMMRSESETWGLWDDFARVATKCIRCGEWGAGVFCHECGDALTPESHAAAKQESARRG